MSTKLLRSLDPVLHAARAKNQLTWLHFYAPWSEEGRAWREELLETPAWARLQEQMQVLEWNRDWSPEVDQGIQSFMQARAGHQGWPVNIFLSPEGRAVFVCGALQIPEFVEITRQLLVAWQSDAPSLRRQAEKEFEAFRKSDPLAFFEAHEPETSGDVGPSGPGPSGPDTDLLGEAALYRFLTPLEKSLQMDTGFIGRAAVFQYPAAYRALLGFQDLARWGELSLVRLARSPLNDVIGGGFFRAALADEGVADMEARASWSHVTEVSTEKLLVENAELLETYIEASQIRKAPYLSQAAFELLDAIMEDFGVPLTPKDESSRTFSSALTSSKKFYDLGPEDLLKALPPRERQSAQAFFGISSKGARLPRITTEVLVLSEFIGTPPVDLRLQLVDGRKRLKAYRRERSRAPLTCPPERVSELTLLRALAFAAFSFDTPQISEICVDMLDRYREQWTLDSGSWSAREKGAYLRALTAMARLHSAHREPELAQRCFEDAEAFIFGLTDPLFREAVVDVPFLGPRLDVCDHTGLSGLASLLAGLLDYNALSRMGLRGKSGLPVEIRADLTRALRYARPLGLHAAGIYGVLMRYRSSVSDPL